MSNLGRFGMGIEKVHQSCYYVEKNSNPTFLLAYYFVSRIWQSKLVLSST